MHNHKQCTRLEYQPSKQASLRVMYFCCGFGRSLHCVCLQLQRQTLWSAAEHIMMVTECWCRPAGSLHTLQADIERLSTQMQHSLTSSRKGASDAAWQQLSAQHERLARTKITLCNSPPMCVNWGWMGAEPPGTTVGDLRQKVAALEGSLSAVQR